MDIISRRAVLSQIYDRLAQIQHDLRLPKTEVNSYNHINAYLSEVWVTLAETRSHHLKAYGPVPEELAAYLDQRLDQIDSLASRLRQFIEDLKGQERESRKSGPDP